MRSLVLLLALASGAVLARDAAMDTMRDLLNRGYYNSAAHLNGPNLVESFPDDPEAHFLYARALFLVGEIDAAAARLAIANERTVGGIPPGHVHLGALLRAAQGDAAGAVRALQNAFLRSQRYEYAMDWARVAWQAGMYEDAIEAFTAAAATEAGRREPWPHLGRGRLLAAVGRTEAAIEAFERAIDVYETNAASAGRLPSPAYVEAWYRLGEALESLGRVVEADGAYRAARTADPNFGPAIQALERLSRRVD